MTIISNQLFIFPNVVFEILEMELGNCITLCKKSSIVQCSFHKYTRQYCCHGQFKSDKQFSNFELREFIIFGLLMRQHFDCHAYGSYRLLCVYTC